MDWLEPLVDLASWLVLNLHVGILDGDKARVQTLRTDRTYLSCCEYDVPRWGMNLRRAVMRRIQWGFIGGIFLILLFGYFIHQGLKVAKQSDDLKKSYLALGIVVVIGVQVLINLAVVVGLIPVTGITLPFISYGGSSLVITLALVGLLLNVSKQVKYANTLSWRR